MKRLTYSFIFGLALMIFGSFTAFAQESVSGKVYWRGAVDNKVRLTVFGTTIEQTTVEGQTLADGVYSFTAPLPSSAVNVAVNKLEGRSTRVTVIQQPNAANDFKAVIEIHDERGGSAEYLLEISW